MRLVNPKKESYHSSLIREFSDISRFIASGSTKGFVTNRYAWFANFANKFKDNDSFNRHTAYVSFFSDHEIFISEYANVDKLVDIFPIIRETPDVSVPTHSHELSTKQYSKIAQKYSGFDIIEFINQSELCVDEVSPIKRYHSFYYAPVIYEVGYRVRKDSLLAPWTQTGYDMYLWANRYQSTLTIRDYSFEIDICTTQDDVFNEAKTIIDMVSDEEKLVDYKVLPYDTNWSFIDSSASNVFYPFDLDVEQPSSNRPYIGFPIFYRESKNINPDTGVRTSEFIETATEHFLMPQISYKNILERQKSIISFESQTIGRDCFHASGICEESDDQSQIIFDICRHYIYDAGTSDYRVGQKKEDGETGPFKIVGIDIDVERNRRNSAVVTTYPYMTAKAVGNGEVIDYKFVRDDGDDIIAGGFPAYRYLCLKLKAPHAFITKLDAELNKKEFNTDIMHTVYVTSPAGGIDTDVENSRYERFRGILANYFVRRQEYALDDLVDGIVGVGRRSEFWTDATNIGSGYLDDKAKISGMGYYVKTGDTTTEYAKFYCNNYISKGPKDSVKVEVLFAIDSVENYELFRPMLKIAGVRGYIKIISRSAAFKPVVLNDGTEEVIYDIEFPYCPGSYNERVSATASYKKTQIFYKDSYINAGSQAIDANGHCDGYNARYAPVGQNSFSRIQMFRSIDCMIDQSNYTESDPEFLGGNIYNIMSRPINRLIYPSYLSFCETNHTFLALTKPREETYNEAYGTFEMKFDFVDAGHLQSDVKMAWCVDNRVWKFGENKYSSYINRECPSYVMEFDASALSNEFGKEQYKYAGIPDIKRWLYAKAIAFCSTLNVPEAESSEDNVDGTRDIPTSESKSDVMIEIWDNAYKLTDLSIRPMWRPFSMSVYDNMKSPSKPLVTGLHAIGTKTLVYDNLYSVVLGKFDSEEDGLTLDEINSINEKSNLVLFDSIANKTYHIAYIEDDSSDSDNIKAIAYITFLDSSVELPTDDGYLVDPYEWTGPLSIYEPYEKLNKSTDFSFDSCKVINSDVRIRYLDFGDKESDDSEFNRYVNDSGKIYIRIRPLKAREHPVAYDSIFGNTDLMQYIGEESKTANIYTNVEPWYDATVPAYDYAFDWSKIDIIEHVRLFGLNYFSLLSK